MIPADYEPVEDRLRAFWSENLEGRVTTEMVRDDDVIVFRAEVFRNAVEARPTATGYAHQRILAEPPPGKKGPNEFAPEWTSPYEVAETSAIGRALANMGYAAKGKRPSREEVSKSQASAPRAGGNRARTEGHRDARVEGHDRVGADPSAGGKAPAVDASTGAVADSGEGHAAPVTRVFPKTPDQCRHIAKLVPYEGEQVCSACGLPDALMEGA